MTKAEVPSERRTCSEVFGKRRKSRCLYEFPVTVEFASKTNVVLYGRVKGKKVKNGVFYYFVGNLSHNLYHLFTFQRDLIK